MWSYSLEYEENQRSVDAWIDWWISDHGYESGNDMYGYPMIWTWDDYSYVENAYSISDYRGLCDEVQEALENSKSEKKFKEELDNLIDDHLEFVSDEQIDEMNEAVDHTKPEPADDNILYLDDYTEDELRQLPYNQLAKNKTKLYYHNVLYQYEHDGDLTILDADIKDVVIDIPIVNSRTSFMLRHLDTRMYRSLKFNLPCPVYFVTICHADCQILDLSSLQCKDLSIGAYLFDSFVNTEIVKLPTDALYDNPTISFGPSAFVNSRVKTITNSESIWSIRDNCFENCKNLKSLSLNPKCCISDYAFKNSSLKFIDWGTDSADIEIVNYRYHNHKLGSDLKYAMSNPFEGTSYQAEFIEEYVQPYLDEIGE